MKAAARERAAAFFPPRAPGDSGCATGGLWMRLLACVRRRCFVVRGRIFLVTADPVLFGGPGAEVDLFAAFGAERAKAVFRHPADILAAGGTFDDGCHFACLHRLHSVS